MKIINIQGAHTVVSPDYGTAEVGPDGTFELDHQFALDLLEHSPTQWRREHDHAVAVSTLSADLYDPLIVSAAVAAWSAEVAALEAGREPAEPPTVTLEGWRMGRWSPDARTLGLAAAHVQLDDEAVRRMLVAAVECDELRARMTAPVPAATAAPEPGVGSGAAAPGLVDDTAPATVAAPAAPAAAVAPEVAP